MDNINGKKISRSFTYEEYREHIHTLFAEGKTTGENHSEEYLHYTELNIQRMQRWEKKYVLEEETKLALSQIKKKQTWLVITEAWCGDVAPNLPLIHLMTQQNDLIQLQIILRDENTNIMQDFLTNGAMAIPKMAIIEEEKVLGVWGPRPSELQKMVMDNKHSESPLPYEEFSVIVQKWYNKNKGLMAQKEIVGLL